MIYTREDVIEMLNQMDDPEELCADLIEAASCALSDGDFSGLELILEEFHDFFGSSDWGVQKSWREVVPQEEIDEDL